MLKIIEVKSEEHFSQLRKVEKSEQFDYLYLLKYCNQIKMSDEGQIKNFSGVYFCETEEEYDNIKEKENILYIVGNKIYFNNNPLLEEYNEEEISATINEALKELQSTEE